MTDFLSRLTERTLGLADVVRPRIPPLFGLDTSMAPADLAGVTDAGIASQPDAWPTDDHGRTRARLSFEPIAEPPGSPPARSAQPQRSRLASVDASDSSPPEAASDSKTLLRPQPIAPERDPPLVAASRPPAGEATPPASESPVLPPPSGEAQSPRRAPQHLAPAPAGVTDSVALDVDQVEETAGKVTRLVARPDQMPEERPLGASATTWRDSARDAEPTVNVTIGRIEVRAVYPSSQPASPPRRLEPQLTIEEYARQRREGLR